MDWAVVFQENKYCINVCAVLQPVLIGLFRICEMLYFSSIVVLHVQQIQHIIYNR